MKKIILFILFFGFVVSCSNSEPVAIVVTNNQSLVEKTAAKQLQKYLSKLYPDDDYTIVREMPSDNRKTILIGGIQKLAEYEDLLPAGLPLEHEGFSISTTQSNNREVGAPWHAGMAYAMGYMKAAMQSLEILVAPSMK